MLRRMRVTKRQLGPGVLMAWVELASPALEASRVREAGHCCRHFTAVARRQQGGDIEDLLVRGPVRVRFAPSPTGYLHLGGLRTALFNYLMARKYGGSFILRIEDTDKGRFVEGATENIIQTLQLTGLDYDEGPGKHGKHGPYFQSQRVDLYQRYADELLKNGHAYRCFCTPQELESMRLAAQQQGKPPRYDRRCLHLSQRQIDTKMSQGEPHTVRFFSPDEPVVVRDLVYGCMRMRPSAMDDSVLLKSDGTPTYHLASIVDDHLMEITHVLRGEEWLVSTPKHLALFRALGWDPPQYAHLPLLLNSDESKLSKRSGHADVKELLRRGYLPEAVINFAALLGWNPKTTDELFSLPELIEKFSVQGLNRGNPVVNTDKLQWFNKNYIRDRIQQGRLVGDLVDSVRDLVAKEFGLSTDVENDLDGRISRAFQMAKDRLVFPSDVTKEAKFMFRDPDLNSEEARSLVGALPKSQMLRVCDAAIELLSRTSLPTPADGATVIASICQATGLSKPQVMKTLRWAWTGQRSGPKIPEILQYLGEAAAIRRLRVAMDRIRA